MTSSWFLFFSYHNDARSNKHQTAVCNVRVVECLELNTIWCMCVCFTKAFQHHTKKVQNIGPQRIPYPNSSTLCYAIKFRHSAVFNEFARFIRSRHQLCRLLQHYKLRSAVCSHNVLMGLVRFSGHTQFG